jgi:N-acetylglucosaminyldiphosphoundecaprenol N-acetyl-beta-D-mannosaminyltransferase
VNILGVGITPVNLAQAVATLEKWRDEGTPEYVCCTSIHGLVEAERDAQVRRALNGAGLATEDGMPLVWWCRRACFLQAGRVCGYDLLDAMCLLGEEERAMSIVSIARQNKSAIDKDWSDCQLQGARLRD